MEKEEIKKIVEDFYKEIETNDLFENKILGRKVDSYLPFYDEFSDYNTNAKSYYDYLARYNRILKLYSDLINRLLRRNIEVEDTKTIEFLKFGDWIDNEKCIPDNFDDLIKLLANVKVSKGIEEIILPHLQVQPFTLKNSIKIKDEGIWSPDYTNVIQEINREIGEINKTINNIQEDIKNIFQEIEDINNNITDINNNISNLTETVNSNNKAIKKIIENLFNAGAIDKNDIDQFDFINNIANGNINLYGGKPDGNSYIRTNKGKNENDLVGGI